MKYLLKAFAIVKGSVTVSLFIVNDDTDELFKDFKVIKDLIPDQVFLMSFEELAKNDLK